MPAKSARSLTAATKFTIPPSTRITIEDTDHLACEESKTSDIMLLRNVVVHSKDIFWLGQLGRAQVSVCVDRGC